VVGSYEGTVSEKGGKVELSPELRAENGPICGYRISASYNEKLPFEVSIVFLQDIMQFAATL